ncbi:hypothetical protein G6F42_021602 [Rhizopus arrhizus]|nr:hypothetical protein G6F42_021602 [Rhizopus arrhizus]
MFLDAVKVRIFRSWSFEMTAKVVPTRGRKAKLAHRKEAKAKGLEVEAAWKKIQIPVEASAIAVAFQNYAQKAN